MIKNAKSAEEEVEILNVTVGKPTKLSDLTYLNSASLSVSRRGVAAAFYPKPETGPRFYRTSTDGGETWGEEMESPHQLAGGASSVALRDGGVLRFLTSDSSFKGEAEFHKSPMEGEYKAGWLTLHSTFAWFNDDYTQFEAKAVQVYMPDAVTTKQAHLGVSTWPIFDKGKILQLPNGDLLAPMYGLFKGDTRSRVVLSVSSDRGHTWRYYATVADGRVDPNPELPGQYNGPCEPSIELMSNGQMICVMRTQYSHLPSEYRPMSVSWSDDLGKTWTEPRPTNPHLMTIWPTVQMLDNGVLACVYGRPGFHVAFSTDYGRTWRDRISFSHAPEPVVTGQVDGIKVGPNKLLSIGGTEGGAQVFPVTVERVRISPTRITLSGQVVDVGGAPIPSATVERGPNRYVADDWIEDKETELDLWKAAPRLIGNPRLSYRSIQSVNGYPTAKSEVDGRFRFTDVELGECVLTVEAEGCVPQHRHVRVGLQAEPQDFTLKQGRLVRGQVVDERGKPIGGVCVVLNRWHCHTDPDGYYHWAVKAPVPEQVTLRIYKRYSDRYETLKTTVALSQLERQPTALKNR